jgi:hypothetical protein
MTLAIALPTHLYGYVEASFLGGSPGTYEPAILFGLTVPRARAVGLSVMLECGAVYREVPPHAWAFVDGADLLTLSEAQAWDCFGGEAQIVEYAYLRDIPVYVEPLKQWGLYTLTVEFGENGYSLEPTQSKCLHMIRLDSGAMTLQPNNFLRWYDASFTDSTRSTSWLRTQSHTWSAESLRHAKLVYEEGLGYPAGRRHPNVIDNMRAETKKR